MPVSFTEVNRVAPHAEHVCDTTISVRTPQSSPRRGCAKQPVRFVFATAIPSQRPFQILQSPIRFLQGARSQCRPNAGAADRKDGNHHVLVHSSCGDLCKVVSGGAVVLTCKTFKNQLLTSDANMAMATKGVNWKRRRQCQGS
jgi:hypothetical protein